MRRRRRRPPRGAAQRGGRRSPHGPDRGASAGRQGEHPARSGLLRVRKERVGEKEGIGGGGRAVVGGKLHSSKVGGEQVHCSVEGEALTRAWQSAAQGRQGGM